MNDLLTATEIERMVEGRRIILEARTFRLRRPFFGLVWLSPIAVRAQTAQGERRLPIRDVTRWWQLAAYGFSLLCVVIGLAIAGREPKE
jgi:hypothetical protein